MSHDARWLLPIVIIVDLVSYLRCTFPICGVLPLPFPSPILLLPLLFLPRLLLLQQKLGVVQEKKCLSRGDGKVAGGKVSESILTCHCDLHQSFENLGFLENPYFF